MIAMMSKVDANLCRAQNTIDKIWKRRSDRFLSRVADGRPIESFPDLSEAEAERTASEARSFLAEIEGIDIEALPHQLALTVKLICYPLKTETQASNRYWLAQECGMFPSMFPVGPYGG